MELVQFKNYAQEKVYNKYFMSREEINKLNLDSLRRSIRFAETDLSNVKREIKELDQALANTIVDASIKTYLQVCRSNSEKEKENVELVLKKHLNLMSEKMVTYEKIRLDMKPFEDYLVKEGVLREEQLYEKRVIKDYE